ncbi:uncharacterized protein LOC124326580 [Daphnia pulicaria]|uniref:uncharacterized protein LOC124326580 n=1 Tax=Daphnia pulicaria TaxID=35523 RepID=UPI001EEAD01D|nr:uncharacterized protein LOC124326580 [Daphnia pulicaria]
MVSSRRITSVWLLNFFWAFVMISAAVEASKNGGKRVGFKKNVNTANQWSCKHPQPRLVYISQMEDYAAPNVVYLPSALLVHRCDDSAGCCLTPGQTCSSVEHLEELVNFVVHEHHHAGQHHHGSSANKKLNRKATVTVPVKNHTQCECVGRNNLRARRSSLVHRIDMTVQ